MRSCPGMHEKVSSLLFELTVRLFTSKGLFPFISFFYIVSLKGQILQHHQRDKKDENKTKSQTQAHRTRQAINDLFLFKLSRNSMVACVGCNKVGHIKRNWVLPIRLVLHQYSGEHRPFDEGRLCRMTLQEGYSSGLTCWYQTSRSPVLWTCRLLRLVCLKREQLVNIFFLHSFIHRPVGWKVLAVYPAWSVGCSCCWRGRG